MLSQIIANSLLLFLLTDTLGSIPIFLGLLKNIKPARRRYILVRETIISGLLLIFFALVGNQALQFLNVSLPALEISGAILLFLIALGMVFPNALFGGEQFLDTEPLIVPIAIPLIAGPAALVAVVVHGSNAAGITSLIIAIIIVTAVNCVVLGSSSLIARLFGESGLKALERLMGLILITFAVQMMISGIKKLILMGLT